MYKQLQLRAGDRRLTCWSDTSVKVGNVITLKKDPSNTRWEVIGVSETALPQSPDTKWRVGGL